jgi:hypothetical protein
MRGKKMLLKLKGYGQYFYFSSYNILSQIFGLFNLYDQTYFCSYKVKYYSQWESNDLNQKIELGVVDAMEDPLWHRSGAIDQEDYKLWSNNICAIACFRMIADNLGISSEEMKTILIARESTKYGTYELQKNGGEIDGIFWKPFSTFLLEKYNIRSCILRYLTVTKMRKLLLSNKIIFLSVSPFFHHDNNKAKILKRRGHVILVHGFLSKDGMIKGFFIKDPGAWIENNSQECFVSTEKLLKNYSGRAFLLDIDTKV